MANYEVTVERVEPRLIAAVRRRATPAQIPSVFRPALDVVWAFLRAHDGLWTDGHNLFLYAHGTAPEMEMDVAFGVEVTRRFEGDGEVACLVTPAGEGAILVHRGPYDGLPGAHGALHQWCAANQRKIGAFSWEIYGHWSDDPATLETTVVYLLA